MNWIDISILVIISFSILIGIFRGFIREVLSLLNWSSAIFATFYFHDKAVALLSRCIESVSMCSIAAFVIVFLVFIIIGSLLTHFIGFKVKKSGLSGTDRMLGLIFGFLRGVLVAAIIVTMVSFTPIKAQKVWKEAMILPAFVPLVKWLNTTFSEKITVALEEPTLKSKLTSFSTVKKIQSVLNDD